MKKPSWIDDFKAFIARGNVMDMAVGVVIGGAFTAIVNALVECVINPIIGLICGGIDFSSLTIGLFPIGGLVTAIINFLCIAFVVFWMTRVVHKVTDRKQQEDAANETPAEPEPTREELLLTEIRDLLKEKKE